MKKSKTALILSSVAILGLAPAATIAIGSASTADAAVGQVAPAKKAPAKAQPKKDQPAKNVKAPETKTPAKKVVTPAPAKQAQKGRNSCSC